jgi:AcrR family transcriptional regulator
MPRVVDGDERRAELIAATSAEIASRGLANVTLRSVARARGWTTGIVTHYFADKRELLLFTFRSSWAQRHAAREARDPRRPKEALLSSLEGALPLDDARRRHWMVTVAFCAQAAGDEELSRAQRDAYRDFRDGLAELVRRGAGRRRDDAVARAERLIAVADGIAVQALFDPESWPPERQLATLHATVEPMMAR